MALRVDFEAYLNEEWAGKPFGVAELLAMEDEGDINVAVVMPANQNAATKQTYLQPDNLRVADAIRGNARCIGCATINPTFGPSAGALLRDLALNHGFKGVKLMAVLHNYTIDDPVIDPIMQIARDTSPFALGFVSKVEARSRQFLICRHERRASAHNPSALQNGP